MGKVIRSRVVQADAATSYWQPVPANGHVELHLGHLLHDSQTAFESGLQEVGVGGRVREHAHHPHEELILVIDGEGTAVVEGVEHPMRSGTSLYLAPNEKHTFINTGESPLRFFWVLMPGGLGDFFRAIGRERDPSQAPPAPFARPDDVAAIERETVFSHADQQSSK